MGEKKTVARRNNSPSALELKCIEVWLLSCTLFVFLALVEYFIVLFGMRYDKHWRHRKRDLDGDRSAPALFGSNKVHAAAVATDNASSVGTIRIVSNRIKLGDSHGFIRKTNISIFNFC